MHCMASAIPELWLDSQLQRVTAPWPVPNYTSLWLAHASATFQELLPNSEKANSQIHSLNHMAKAHTITPTNHVSAKCWCALLWFKNVKNTLPMMKAYDHLRPRRHSLRLPTLHKKLFIHHDACQSTINGFLFMCAAECFRGMSFGLCAAIPQFCDVKMHQ